MTANLRDFVEPSRARLRARRVSEKTALIDSGGRRLVVARPYAAATWIDDPERYRREVGA